MLTRDIREYRLKIFNLCLWLVVLVSLSTYFIVVYKLKLVYSIMILLLVTLPFTWILIRTITTILKETLGPIHELELQIEDIVDNKTGTFTVPKETKLEKLILGFNKILKERSKAAAEDTALSNELEIKTIMLQAREFELNYLGSIADQITLLTDISQLQELVLNATRSITSLNYFGLWITENNKLIPRALFKLDAAKTTEIKLKDAEQLLKSGKPITVESISDYDSLSDTYKLFLTERKAKAMLLIPLKAKNKLLGAILTAFDFPHEFHKTEMRFMTLIANLTSNAIYNLHLYKQLEALSITDELTGLYNRRYFETKLLEEHHRAQRYKHNLTLLLIDIDHFKLINDTWGHNIGDEVLIEVSKTIKSVARLTDIVVRYGGEEFAIIMPETPPKEGMEIAEKIRLRIEQEVVKKLQEIIESYQKTEIILQNPVTVSVGLSYFPLSKDIESLIKSADESLYKAKQEGRNRVCQYGSENTSC